MGRLYAPAGDIIHLRQLSGIDKISTLSHFGPPGIVTYRTAILDFISDPRAMTKLILEKSQAKADMVAPAADPQAIFVTIDSEHTHDIDDALSIKRHPDGAVSLLVAIADPTSSVKADSPEDQRARLIAATAYAGKTTVKSMLPPHISQEGNSLVAGRARAAFVMAIELNSGLEVAAFDVSRQMVTVTERLSYEQIPGLVSQGVTPIEAMLSTAANVAMMLLQSRRSNGAMAFYDLSRMLLTDEEGNVRQLHSTEEVVGNIIVQEVMVLANRCMADFCIRHDIPAVYRNHEPRLAAPPAGELASTIEGWLANGNRDTADAASQFGALTGRAKYAATASGHYGLNLVQYGHFTSPLRRYADLVNLRQVRAYLQKAALPYRQETLVDLSLHLNDTLERRREERSEGFKASVHRVAQRALDSGAAHRLADHEITAAVKLARNAGYLPEVLSGELVRRMNGGILPDSAAQCLVTEVPLDALGEDLRIAFWGWMKARPTAAVHLLNHGEQTGFFAEVGLSAEGHGAGFVGAARLLRKADGAVFQGSGTGAKKRDAEQAAAVDAIAIMLGVPLEAPGAGTPHTAPLPANQNWKGQVLELCAQRKWPAPVFESSGKGPPNQMQFSATAAIVVRGVSYVGNGSGQANKKAAENLAAAELYARLRGSAQEEARTRSAMPQQGVDNPVGLLQELAMRRGCMLPDYKIDPRTNNTFECTVTTHFGAAATFNATSGNKKEAKREAASKAVAAIQGQ